MLKRIFAKPFTDAPTALQFFQVSRYATFFLCGVILVKSGWSTANIGLYETMLFLASAFSFFWVNGIITTMLVRYRENTQRKNYLFNVFFLVLLLCILCFVIITSLRDTIGLHFKVPGSRLVFLYALFMLFNTPGFLVENMYLALNKPRSLVVYGAVIFSLQLFIVIVVAMSGMDLTALCIAYIALAFVKLIWLLALLKAHSEFSVDSAFIKKHLWTSWPLILAALLSGSGDYIDKMIVSTLFDKQTFAVFQYGARELPLSLLLANALSNAMIPVLATNKEHLPVALAELKQRSEKLMYWLFPVSILLMLSSKWLFLHVFNTQFSNSAVLFNISLLLVISRVVFPQTILIALGYYKLIWKISFIELLINVVGSVFLAYKIGFIGVVYGTVIAWFSEKILLQWAVTRVTKVKITDYIPVRLWLLFSMATVVAFWIVK